MDKLLNVVRSICWCFFKASSHPQSDKAAGKYQKVPNQPSLQLAENPGSQNWNDGIDDFEDFDDNWDDLENPSPQVKPKSGPVPSHPALNGTSVPSSSPKQPLPKLQPPAPSAAPSKPQVQSPTEHAHSSPTASTSLSIPAPIAPPPSHSSGPVGMSLVRPKKAESNPKRAAPAAPVVEEPPKAVEADLFSDLGMAPTYKEPEKIKAAPKRVEPADPVASAFSQLDSLLEEATSAPAAGNTGGWLNTQLDAGLGLDLSEEIAAVESEAHAAPAAPQRSTRDVFDLTASAFDDAPAPAVSKPKAKDGHAHAGLGAVAIDDLDTQFDDFVDSL